jgi:hypothetical protein
MAYLYSMNIRKIIQEEINDFNWTEDIQARITSCDQLKVGDKVMVTSNFEDLGAVEEIGLVVRVYGEYYRIAFNKPFGDVITRSGGRWTCLCENLNTTDIVTLDI